jgi:hypothetical protein
VLYGAQFKPIDLKLSIIEAKDYKTRTSLDHALLFCYRYDTSREGFVLPAIRIMQAGGLLTVLLLAFFITFFIMREMNVQRKSVT